MSEFEQRMLQAQHCELRAVQPDEQGCVCSRCCTNSACSTRTRRNPHRSTPARPVRAFLWECPLWVRKSRAPAL